VRRQRHIAENDIELIGFTSYIRIHSTGDSFRINVVSIAPLFYALSGSPVVVFKEP
jgi:hypothetical protein